LVHELAELAVRARRPASAAQCPLTGHADVRLWQHLRPCRVWNPFDGCHWQVTCLSSDQRDPNCKSKTANTSRSDGHYGRAPASRRQRTAGSAQWKRQPASLQAQAGDVAPQTYHEVMRQLSEEARRRAGESARPRAHTDRPVPDRRRLSVITGLRRLRRTHGMLRRSSAAPSERLHLPPELRLRRHRQFAPRRGLVRKHCGF
jgi:hypothetical protein